jgi:hypothetical protein
MSDTIQNDIPGLKMDELGAALSNAELDGVSGAGWTKGGGADAVWICGKAPLGASSDMRGLGFPAVL